MKLLIRAKIDSPPGKQSDKVSDERLAQFMDELGLCDVWRTRNPMRQQYSCLSSSHATLSRIDMAFGNGDMVQLVKNIVYAARGVSDHSPLTMTIQLEGQNPPRAWSISPFWLELMREPTEVVLKLKEFVTLNKGSTSAGIVRDTLKGFLRGLIIQQVVKIKRRSREWEEVTGREAVESENQYVVDPTPEKKEVA